MNTVETALVLERFAVAYRCEVPPEALELWSSHLAGVDADVAMDAAENLIGTETFFPMVAVFQKEVAAVIRDRQKEAEREKFLAPSGPDRSCPTCHGKKWYEGDPVPEVGSGGEILGYAEQWKPCSRCAPVEFSRWQDHVLERKAHVRHKHSPDDIESGPGAFIDALKAQLAAHKPDEKPRR